MCVPLCSDKIIDTATGRQNQKTLTTLYGGAATQEGHPGGTRRTFLYRS